MNIQAIVDKTLSFFEAHKSEGDIEVEIRLDDIMDPFSTQTLERIFGNESWLREEVWRLGRKKDEVCWSLLQRR